MLQGKIIAPGLIDMHVHLREPGCEEDETIRSGTAAALAVDLPRLLAHRTPIHPWTPRDRPIRQTTGRRSGQLQCLPDRLYQ